MKPKRYSSDGIILARNKFGEADRIITVYSKHFGKLSLIAKGVRYPHSRKRGHLEVFNHIHFTAARGKNIDLITEVETINSFREVRSQLRKVTLAYYFMEVIRKLTQDEEKNEKLFEIILAYLEKTKNNFEQLKKLRHSFVLDTLVVLGFWPIGKELENPDKTLEEVTERNISSARIGKKLLE